jgi:Skp family chaperone for outer membrane proteins
MPDRAFRVLIVSVTDILDRSKAGQEAAKALEGRFVKAKEKRATMTDAVEAAKFEIDAIREIEGERNRLRDALLVKARVAAEAVRVEKGADIVVDKSLALAADTGLDVTDEVLRRLNG